MRLDELGERAAVDLATKLIDRGQPFPLGDDCGAFPWGDDYLLITTDIVNASMHLPAGAKPAQVGWHVVAVNLSDIAAMGGTPIGFAAALSLPRDLDTQVLKELERGMDACAKEFGIHVLAGDTKEGKELTIAGTAVGKVRREHVLLRKGASPGDILAVTGDLGRAGWAARALREGRETERALDALLRPYPRLREGQLLAASGGATSCMDISDGLGTTLHQMGRAGGYGFAVAWDQVPRYRELTPTDMEPVLYFGGDYELVNTVKPAAWPRVQASFRERRLALTAIGEVTAEKAIVLRTSRGTAPLENRGWEHFRSAALPGGG